MDYFKPYFKTEEFDSPDAPGSGAKMQPEFMGMLQQLRAACNFPFKISSGYRTAARNAAVGGAKGSWHLQGRAADIFCNNGAQRAQIIKHAIALGFKGIGVGKNFIHVDNGDRANLTIWVY